VIFVSFLVLLDVKGAGLKGSLPTGLWELTLLEHLQLGNNDFSGSLPSAISQLTQLRHLLLARSGLEGTLPSTLGDLDKLERVQLEFNNFKGDVSDSVCAVPTLIELSADCDKGGKVDCSCCTSCCTKKPHRKCKVQETGRELRNDLLTGLRNAWV
jgi:hypothetical protein